MTPCLPAQDGVKLSRTCFCLACCVCCVHSDGLVVASEVDWDIIWADVHWVRDCFDHVRLEEHQVRAAVVR
jgi:hypothetical protein